MKILLTGFDPFGGEKINPAQEAVNRVSDNINGAEVLNMFWQPGRGGLLRCSATKQVWFADFETFLVVLQSSITGD